MLDNSKDRKNQRHAFFTGNLTLMLTIEYDVIKI